jgi:two-component system response regulator (stage 0 sporulation protein F)
MRRILIVDDDQRIIQLLSDCFKDRYTIDIAMDGGEALAIVRRQRPDLVLLDIVLPGMSGIHLLKEIKRMDAGIKVVMISGSDSVGLAAEALQSGAVTYVAKPFDLPGLDRLVSTLIATPSGQDRD